MRQIDPRFPNYYVEIDRTNGSKHYYHKMGKKLFRIQPLLDTLRKPYLPVTLKQDKKDIASRIYL